MRAVGIDIGTAFIASARYHRSNIQAKYVRDGFIVLKYVPQRETMLRASKIPFIIKPRPNAPNKKDIYVIGNPAFDLAVLHSEELRRPVASGVISAQEKDTEFILKEIIRQVAGQGQVGDVAYFSIPADPIDKNFNVVYHREMFKRFLKDLGYKAVPLNEAMAVAYAELEDKDLTGLCVSMGAGLVNVALSYKGLEIFAFSVAYAGDKIDEQVAQSRGIPTSDAAAEKEKAEFDLLNPTDDVEEAIQIFYKAMLEYVFEKISDHMEQHKRKIKLKEPLQFVVAGGTTMPKGFLQFLADALKQNPFPIPLQKVWQAKNPVMAVCRGCLIAADKELGSKKHNGVQDISDGQNLKHAYPQAPKEPPQKTQEQLKEKSTKEKRKDADKARVIQGSTGGFEEAIDLTIAPTEPSK